jgi:hypothetical protein
MDNESALSGSRLLQELTPKQRSWLNHYQACRASGKTMAEYAREHGLALKSFYFWKRRLRQLGVIGSDLSAPTKSPLFFPVRVREESRPGAACTVRFANGIECEMFGLDAGGVEHLLDCLCRLSP